jgi:hypothetical protein
MAVVQTTDQLLEDTFCRFFLKLAPLSDKVQEITSSCDLDDKKNVLLSLKVFKKTHYVFVPCLLQNYNFLENFASLGVLPKVLFVDTFNGNHLRSQVV